MGNLDEDISEEELRKAFKSPCTDCKLPKSFCRSCNKKKRYKRLVGLAQGDPELSKYIKD